VVQGRKDSMVPPDNAEFIHKHLGSTLKHLVYLERSDHVVTQDYDRQVLFEKLGKFLAASGKSID
jgi:carboxylesterase